MDTTNTAQPIKHKLPTPCGAHVLARALKRHGVEVLFGQSLPSPLHLVLPECGMRQIAYRTENAGGAMADGYARASQKVAVVTAQNGPAAALLAPALAEALKAWCPLLPSCRMCGAIKPTRTHFRNSIISMCFAAWPNG